MNAHDVRDVLDRTATEIGQRLQGLEDWGLAGTREGQYRSDLVADEAALEILGEAGLGVISEESGPHHADRQVVVVVDPVDGSTNASRGLPWWATSLCALDADGPLTAVVVNQVTHTRYDAVRGEGARVNATPIRPSSARLISDSLVAFSGYPTESYGWSQFRSLGAAALDLCAVASGMIDGFVDCADRSLAPWDYLGGLLVCREAGALVTEPWGRDLVVRDHTVRRTVVAAATPELQEVLVERRRTIGPPL